MRFSLMGAMMGLALAGAAGAQTLPARTLSAALAADLARETVDQCHANGFAVTVTVVDAGGALKAFLRGDGTSLATVEVSQLKAHTAVSFGVPSSVLAQAAANGGGAANLVHVPGMFVVPGGLPIKVGDQLAGAIGVSGAPGGEKDEACAVAALAKFADRLK